MRDCPRVDVASSDRVTAGVDQSGNRTGRNEFVTAFDSATVVACDGLATKHRFDADGEGVSASGLRYRKRLLLAVALRQRMGIGFQMWTLTLDPWPFVEGGKPGGWEELSSDRKEAFYQGPVFQAACRAAYQRAKKKRFVGECMRKLRIELGAFEYVVSLEFQGNGMPHYHVLLFKPGQVYIPHVLMLKCWGRGGVRFSGEKKGREHAARYATKYLVKGVRSVDWMDDAMVPRYMRFISCSRGFWGPAEAGASEPLHAAPLRRPDATLGEVRRFPGRWRKVLMRVILSTGEVMHRHINMDMTTCIKKMGELGFLGGHDAAGGRRLGSMSFSHWRDGCSVNLLLDYLAHCGAAGEAVASP